MLERWLELGRVGVPCSDLDLSGTPATFKIDCFVLEVPLLTLKSQQIWDGLGLLEAKMSVTHATALTRPR